MLPRAATLLIPLLNVVASNVMAANTRFAMGVHAMALLANGSDKTHTSEQIAASMETNPVVVRRILSSLQAAGLVASQKGPQGGTRLAKPAKRISLAHIYQAIEKGSLFHLPSGGGSKDAFSKRLSPLVKEAFSDAEIALQGRLDAIPLAQLVKRAGKPSHKKRK